MTPEQALGAAWQYVAVRPGRLPLLGGDVLPATSRCVACMLCDSMTGVLINQMCPAS